MINLTKWRYWFLMGIFWNVSEANTSCGLLRCGHSYRDTITAMSLARTTLRMGKGEVGTYAPALAFGQSKCVHRPALANRHWHFIENNRPCLDAARRIHASIRVNLSHFLRLNGEDMSLYLLMSNSATACQIFRRRNSFGSVIPSLAWGRRWVPSVSQLAPLHAYLTLTNSFHVSS